MALQIKTFRIGDAAGEEALNTFLHNKRVHHWEANYSGDPSLGIWNVFVAYEEGGMNNRRDGGDMGNRRQSGGMQNRQNDQRRAARPEPKPIEHTAPPDVPENKMPLYENVRKWRNQVARDEKVKPYILFNNKQLEDMVKTPPEALEGLKAITADMSDELFTKYGNQLLGLLAAGAAA